MIPSHPSFPHTSEREPVLVLVNRDTLIFLSLISFPIRPLWETFGLSSTLSGFSSLVLELVTRFGIDSSVVSFRFSLNGHLRAFPVFSSSFINSDFRLFLNTDLWVL